MLNKAGGCSVLDLVIDQNNGVTGSEGTFRCKAWVVRADEEDMHEFRKRNILSRTGDVGSEHIGKGDIFAVREVIQEIVAITNQGRQGFKDADASKRRVKAWGGTQGECL